MYYQSWHRTTPIRPGKDVLPNVAPGTRLPSQAEEAEQQSLDAASAASTATAGTAHAPRMNDYGSVPRAPGLAVLPSSRSQTQSQPQSQLGVRASGGPSGPSGIEGQQDLAPQKRGLPFDEECKLVYGILYSLRSMVKKLSNKE